MGRTAITAHVQVSMLPGEQAMPRSSCSALSWVTHTPTRSPCVARCTGRLNIWMDLTLRSTRSSGNSMVSFTAREPRRMVPVHTVPCPLIGKQWSMAKWSGPSPWRSGRRTAARISATSASRPMGGRGGWLPRSASAAPSAKGRAARATMGASLNLVCPRAFRMPFFMRSSFSSRPASGSKSSLLRTTIMCSAVSSPMTRHSAVCVWMPLVRSMTRIIMSMICAPPMTVRMRDAWPGQSTSVNWRWLYSGLCRAMCSGTSARKAEKPRSSVMPRSLLCGCLSKLAVEPMVLNARARLVLPLST
mmetsp:Transcript_25297/g.84794  ORF Transcript_25297/g.84794 Transcript_25297/m.84794 type:complete len:303 (-) Transcript_25297:116-1024(-)